MKKITLLLSFLANSCTIIACTFFPDSFCQTGQNTDDIVLSGQVIAVDTTGIDLRIIDIFRGTESRAVIRIWDGTDFDCNGPFSMAAADLGSLGDTLVLILPKITSQENTWDVIGDYRRPVYTTLTTSLRVKQDTVSGFIRSNINLPPGNGFFQKLPYDFFKNVWLEDGNCIDFTLSAKEVADRPSIRFNNPVRSHLSVELGESGKKGWMRIYSLRGVLVREQAIRGDQELKFDLTELQSGVYVLNIEAQGLRSAPMKVVKL